MKKIKFLLFSFCMAIFSFAGLQQAKAQEPCPTGTDIHIANDISGSVDSREFQQSKDFVSLLGANFGTNYGTGNLETRVSISNWSAGSGRFVEYDFPSAGQNYATTISDILSYTTSGRPFRGYTDVYIPLCFALENGSIKIRFQDELSLKLLYYLLMPVVFKWRLTPQV